MTGNPEDDRRELLINAMDSGGWKRNAAFHN